MAIEPKRGCGYRKVNGLYMVGDGIGLPCDRLPFELSVCNCCGQGIKQALGWTWIDVAKFFNGPHMVNQLRSVGGGWAGYPDEPTSEKVPCHCRSYCPLCDNPAEMGRAGLLWIGEKFYKLPCDFVREGVTQGFSRRIKAIPHGFKVGETWVMLAHSKTIPCDPHTNEGKMYKAGIFYAWLPQRIEKVVLESQRGSEEIESLEKRGIVPIFVPDDDPDHQGNVHDDHAREQREKREASDNESND